MIIIWEGDSEKGNIDVKTSARKETRSFEYTSIAIQADSPKQDIEGQENIKPSKPCCKFGPIKVFVWSWRKKGEILYPFDSHEYHKSSTSWAKINH